ncbi:MAG: FecR domain-containing protein [Gemmatimonadales bacterium]|nr:FecR domain-containing protein [Gemmatimonadales bacterium]
MTEQTTDHTYSVLDDMDDLELVTRMLNGQLDPARVEAVRRRLAEDAEFRDLAAPLLLTWTVPPHIERYPRPAGEWERDWSEFAQRAGIAPPPDPKGWRGFLFSTKVRPHIKLLALLPLIPFVTLALVKYVPMSTWAMDDQTRARVMATPVADPRGRIARVPYDTAWIPIGGTGLQVRPALGSDLRVAERRTDGKRQFLLDSGAVRFHVAPVTSADPTLRGHQIDVQTPAGVVSAGESDFTVSVRGDTTDVEVHASGRPGSRFRPVEARATIVGGPALSAEARSYSIPLAAGERTRLVRGQVPARSAGNP